MWRGGVSRRFSAAVPARAELFARCYTTVQNELFSELSLRERRRVRYPSPGCSQLHRLVSKLVSPLHRTAFSLADCSALLAQPRLVPTDLLVLACALVRGGAPRREDWSRLRAEIIARAEPLAGTSKDLCLRVLGDRGPVDARFAEEFISACKALATAVEERGSASYKQLQNFVALTFGLSVANGTSAVAAYINAAELLLPCLSLPVLVQVVDLAAESVLLQDRFWFCVEKCVVAHLNSVLDERSFAAAVGLYLRYRFNFRAKFALKLAEIERSGQDLKADSRVLALHMLLEAGFDHRALAAWLQNWQPVPTQDLEALASLYLLHYKHGESFASQKIEEDLSGRAAELDPALQLEILLTTQAQGHRDLRRACWEGLKSAPVLSFTTLALLFRAQRSLTDAGRLSSAEGEELFGRALNYAAETRNDQLRRWICDSVAELSDAHDDRLEQLIGEGETV